MRPQEWQHPTSAKRLKVLGGAIGAPPPQLNARFVPFCMEMNAHTRKRVPSSSVPDDFQLWYDEDEELRQTGSTNKDSDANIFRAPLVRRLDDADLTGSSSKAGFQESDGIRVDRDGQGAVHHFRPNERQAVLGGDHIHVNHACARKIWTLSMRTARYASGDAYFGVTNASGFQHAGNTVGFDVAGNMLRGSTPQSVPISRNNILKKNLGTSKYSAVRITADVKNGKMIWEVFPGAPPVTPGAKPVGKIEYAIRGWRSARLWVSLKSQNDHVRLHMVETVSNESEKAELSHA